jgi:WD40 repeat protein
MAPCGTATTGDDDDASCASRETTISDLPLAVLQLILASLKSPKDLARATLVAKSWRAVGGGEPQQPWRAFFVSRWGLPLSLSDGGSASGSGGSYRRPCCVTRSKQQQQQQQDLDDDDDEEDDDNDAGGGQQQQGMLFGSPPPDSAAPAPWPHSTRRRRRSRRSSSSEEEDNDGSSNSGEDDGGDLAPRDHHNHHHQWQRLYGRKMSSLSAWSGRFERDALHGHAARVCAARLLPSHGLCASASADGTVRLWDLRMGVPLMQPAAAVAQASSSAAPIRRQQQQAASPHLGGTVRALALDSRTLAAGGADCRLHVWEAGGGGGARPRSAAATSAPASASAWGEEEAGWWAAGGDNDGGDDHGDGDGRNAAPLFDLPSGPTVSLSGHTGPVSALAMTSDALFSGGWDYTVRVWRRPTSACCGVGGDDDSEEDEAGAAAAPAAPTGGYRCVASLGTPDWVTALVARGGRLLVAAGRAVAVHDTATGQRLRLFEGLHQAGVGGMEASHDGASQTLWTAGRADRLLLRHDLRLKRPTVVVQTLPAPATALALDDPWLLVGCADGTVAMFSAGASSGVEGGGGSGAGASTKRRVLCSGGRVSNGVGGAVSAVDLRDGWACAVGEGHAVRTFDFTGPAERRMAAEAAAAAAARAVGVGVGVGVGGGGRRGRRGGRRRGGGGGGARGGAGAGASRSPALPVPVVAAATNSGSSHSAGGGGGARHSSVGALSLPPPPLPPLRSSSSASASRWHQLGGGVGGGGGLSISASPRVPGGGRGGRSVNS